MESDQYFRINEVDLFGLGLVHFSTGFAILNLILGLTPVVFVLSMRLLGGIGWRRRIRVWLIRGRWVHAYSGLLHATQAALRQIFGPSLSVRALDMCARFALIYASGYLLLSPFFTVGHDHFRIAALHLGYALAGGWAGYFLASRLIDEAERGTPGGWLRSRLNSHRGLRVGAYLLLALSLAVSVELGLPKFAAFGVLFGATLRIGFTFIVPVSILLFLIAGMSDFGGNVFAYFIMFPLINALFDWPSWAASRWLMGRLQRDARHPTFLGRLARLACTRRLT